MTLSIKKQSGNHGLQNRSPLGNLPGFWATSLLPEGIEVFE
jgi:hypothetical protein